MKVRTGDTRIKKEVDGSTVEGRNVPPEVLGEFRRKNTIETKEGRAEFDSNGFQFDCFDYRVTSWWGVEGESGPLECTRENKKMVWEFDQDYCGKVLTALNDAFRSREDLAEKNS